MKIVRFLINEDFQFDCTVNTDGDELDLLIGYIGMPEAKISIDENVRIEAKNTKVSIRNYGVLFGGAQKDLSMMMDYQKGACGSVGREVDDVLVIDAGSNSLINRVTPAVNCAEMDVEATHAVTIAELDTKELNYLISRGLTEKQAKAMIIKSKLSPVLKELSTEDKEVAVVKLEEVLEEYL